MATLVEALVALARVHLIEPEANFWTDDELVAHANACFKDLWGAMIDAHEEHYFTVDDTNVSLAASTKTLTGVPADVFRVLEIEPRDVTDTGSSRDLKFFPRKWNSKEFRSARRNSPQDPSGPLTIFYAMTQAGAPVGAPTIRVAPQVLSAVLLSLTYIPTIVNRLGNESNPIPGESDNAVVAWIVAYAKAKEREDRVPDSGWLTVYATEKKSVLIRVAPRQEQEPRCVEGVFDDIAYEDD